jgi:hypothetical protein
MKTANLVDFIDSPTLKQLAEATATRLSARNTARGTVRHGLMMLNRATVGRVSGTTWMLTTISSCTMTAIIRNGT